MSQLIVTGGRAIAGVAKGAAQGFAKSAISLATNIALDEAQALIFGPVKRKVTGPRIESFKIQSSTEGAPIPVIMGRARLAGQIIWASKFRETINRQRTTSGGKGNRGRTETTATTYLYSVSIAIGICSGEVSELLRCWADGKLIDLSKFDYRFYHGSSDQLPDSLIEAVEGADNAPAYRGLSYIVFEDLPLAQFGNRIPQLNFEIERRIGIADARSLESLARSVMIIPATGEEVYGTTAVQKENGLGVVQSENQHYNINGTDFSGSMDQLTGALSNTKHTALTVAWFGTDLRAGKCQLRPGVETLEKQTAPRLWQVGPVLRERAHLISRHNGVAAYGGTPSDQSVIEAIRDIKRRGMSVLFTPFILMDIPQLNRLPDPGGRGRQSSYPWRGRIRPAGGVRVEIAKFFGKARRSHFSIKDGMIDYTGPDEWSLRRMILHYAMLCRLAGGVEGFLLGSEMVDLTMAQAKDGVFPAVAAYRRLAIDVRAILGTGCEISYGADWSEYAGLQGGRHAGDRYFHLDDLWADKNIDFIGIDNYMPISDWRSGSSHLDYRKGYRDIHDISYLQANIRGGEGYEWYYASDTDRQTQKRTRIEDTAYGEDWIFRVKDLWSWWGNRHYNRARGRRLATPTGWIPKSKPIRFTELGCGAINFGSNQPNVFSDPKSGESGRPYFSTGGRDDRMQRRFIEAHLLFWADRAHNPISTIYNGPMVDPDRIYLYCWDARPFPAFPSLANIWADGENWQVGHWLNGRVGQIPLASAVEEITNLIPALKTDTAGLGGGLDGYVIDRPMSVRQMIEPLSGLFQFDTIETEDRLIFKIRTGIPDLAIDESALVQGEGGSPYTINRAQREDQPVSLAISYIDEGKNYDIAIAEARDPAAIGERHVTVEIPVILTPSVAAGRAALLLGEALSMREEILFTLPPSLQYLEPGDVIRLQRESGDFDARIIETTIGNNIEIRAVRTNTSLYEFQPGGDRARVVEQPVIFGKPAVSFLDIPLLPGEETAQLRAVVRASPWPGEIAFYAAGAGLQRRVKGLTNIPGEIGILKTELKPGPVAVYDHAASVTVEIPSGQLQTIDEGTFLAGGNLCAVESALGSWEILQFRDAELIAPDTWRLSVLLRGQAGTELEAGAGALAGALFIPLEENTTPIDMALDEIGVPYDWAIGPAADPVDRENFCTVPFSYEAVGLRPLSPVHIRKTRKIGADHFSWIRRARYGGDIWGAGEPPIGEDFERYRIRIKSAAEIIREAVTDTPDFIYTDSMRHADFPTGRGDDPIPASASFEVAQISAIIGPGRTASIPLRSI